MLSNIRVIGIKTETSQNTQATLSATDYIYAMDVEVNPIVEMIPQDYKTATLDKQPSIVGQTWVEVSFTIPIRGSGTAGTALAPLGAALQAAGMSETIQSGVSVTYAPVTSLSTGFFTPGKSCTIEIYKGSANASGALKQVIKGCVASGLSISGEAGKLVLAKFKMIGIYVSIADASLPSVTYNTNLPKILESATISFHSVTPIMKSFEIDFGLKHAMRDDAASAYGVGGFAVVDREPKGKVVIEAVTVATKNYLSTLLSGTEASMSVAFGSGAGNINTFTMPKTQITKLSHADDNGILKFSLDLKFNKSVGDDWISLVQT